MDGLLNVVKSINSVFWGYLLIFLLCGTGLWFTIYLRGVQVRKFGAGFKEMFKDFSLSGKKAGKQGMSSFQAVATAIAAQVGTGNLVGGATAIVLGGPGALFWMWLAAFFGMATIFVEAVLAQHFKQVDETGQVVGGPAYYISKGIKSPKFAKVLSVLFAIFIILALGFMGNMVQSNSIADAFSKAFGVPTYLTGLVVALLAGLIIFAGISAIASVAEKVVPIMAILYITVGLVVLIGNFRSLPAAIASVFVGAFNPAAVVGGAVGITISKAMRYGVARGLFSNEAGMGSTPHAHAVAVVDNPVKQGTLAVVAVFIDTFVILNLTCFVLLSSNVVEYGSDGQPIMQGIALIQAAYQASILGNAGPAFVSICLLFFAFTTIVGWYYFAETNVRFLFGKKLLVPFKIIVIVCIFVGSLLKLDLVWELADMFNGFMVIPNLIGILLLGGTAKKILDDYNAGKKYHSPLEQQQKKGA